MDSVEDKGSQKLETNVAGSGPMEDSLERSRSLSWSVVPAEDRIVIENFGTVTILFFLQKRRERFKKLHIFPNLLPHQNYVAPITVRPSIMLLVTTKLHPCAISFTPNVFKLVGWFESRSETGSSM
jgi:hypothetical protein